MTHQISMKMRDGREGSITIDGRPGKVSIVFDRPGNPAIGVGLSPAQAELLIDALKLELPAARARGNHG